MGGSGGPLRSLATRSTGRYIVFVHGSLAPSQAEWNVVLDLYRAQPNLAATRTLVYTDGAAPSAAQRADLNAVFGKLRPLLSVMTSSTLARTAGTALSWLVTGLKVFDAHDYEGALDHLGAAGAERRVLRDMVEELKREIAERRGTGARREG